MNALRFLAAVALVSVASPALAGEVAPAAPADIGPTSEVERVEPAGKGVSSGDGGYNLLVVTRDSAVRMTRGMTFHECGFARHRLLGEPATDAEAAADRALDDADSEYMRENGCRSLVHGTAADSYVDLGGGRCSGPGRAHPRRDPDVASAECFK